MNARPLASLVRLVGIVASTPVPVSGLTPRLASAFTHLLTNYGGTGSVTALAEASRRRFARVGRDVGLGEGDVQSLAPIAPLRPALHKNLHIHLSGAMQTPMVFSLW